MGRRAKEGIDWIGIESEYRIGYKSPVEIAKNFGITRQAIEKRAKQEGWERNLTGRVQHAALEIVARHEAAEGQDVIQANAERLASVELTQRDDIRRLRGIVAKMMDAIEPQLDNPDDFKHLGDLFKEAEEGDTGKLYALYRKAVALPTTVSMGKQLADTLKVLIELERKVLRMDETQNNNSASSVDDMLRRIAQGA